MKANPGKLFALSLGLVVGINLSQQFQSPLIEDAAYVFLAVSAIWLLVRLYRDSASITEERRKAS